jgi:hypothetical protein
MEGLVADFDWLLAAGVFIAYFVVDALYAYYTLSVTRHQAGRAATAGSAMYFLMAFGVINYTQNYLYVVPLVLGSWLGTYVIVKYEKEKPAA